MNKTTRTRVLAAVLLLGLVSLLQAASGQPNTVRIKIASQAPDRSPWGKALNEVGAEWYKLSGGRILVEIYPGAIAGNELDQIRKLKIGTIQGAVFSNVGLNLIENSVQVLSTPFLFTTQEEFEHVFEKLKPEFEKQIEEKGYKVLLWSLGGWVHFFAKDTVIYPEDLKKHKVAVSGSDPGMEQIWKGMGFHVVPLDLKDLMVGLQTGLATATYLPTLIAGSGQYFALVPHVLALKVAPLIGGFLLSARTWESVPEEFRGPMVEAVQRISQRVYEETDRLEENTLQAMKDHGLIIDDAPADALDKWREFTAQALGGVIGKAFSRDIYDQVIARLSEFRKKNES